MDLQASALGWRKQMLDPFNWAPWQSLGLGLPGQTAAKGVMVLKRLGNAIL